MGRTKTNRRGYHSTAPRRKKRSPPFRESPLLGVFSGFCENKDYEQTNVAGWAGRIYLKSSLRSRGPRSGPKTRQRWAGRKGPDSQDSPNQSGLLRAAPGACAKLQERKLHRRLRGQVLRLSLNFRGRKLLKKKISSKLLPLLVSDKAEARASAGGGRGEDASSGLPQRQASHRHPGIEERA